MLRAAHFLERLDRVPRAIVDEALDLYRDPVRVAWVIARARVPDDAARVAISLGDPARGPFLVVTRDGHFVTCLGEGMGVGDLTIITRAQLDAYSEQLRDHRRRRGEAEARASASGHSAPEVVGLVHRRADSLRREDFIAVSAWCPFLVKDFTIDLLHALKGFSEAVPLLLAARAARGPVDEALRIAWRDLHSAGHFALLVGMSDRQWLDAVVGFHDKVPGTTFSGALISSRLFGLAMRGAWLGARLGKAMIPVYRLAIEKRGGFFALLDAAIALTAIGVRHASAERDARRALARLRDAASDDEEAQACAKLVASAEYALSRPDEAASRALAIGRRLYVARAEWLDDGSPYKLADASSVPDELARLALFDSDLDVWRADGGDILDVLAAPMVARLAAEDFYWPRDAHDAVGLPYVPTRGHRLLDRFADAAPAPVRRDAARVGRNDPCPCGSGKKHKKCCGR